MIYINPKERSPLSHFRKALYRHLQESNRRYSDQRELVLKLLHEQSHPVSIDYLTRQLADGKKSAGYATVRRHINFFAEMGWLIVINRVKKGYLLKKECLYDEEVIDIALPMP
jgi:Fe2+ or Zn2+ uptake regulation protein